MDIDALDDEGGGGEEGAPAWMATFRDLATLLLTFFVLLLSFANTDVVEFEEMLGSVREAFGVQFRVSGDFEGLSQSPISVGDMPPGALELVSEVDVEWNKPTSSQRLSTPSVFRRTGSSRPPAPPTCFGISRPKLGSTRHDFRRRVSPTRVRCRPTWTTPRAPRIVGSSSCFADAPSARRPPPALLRRRGERRGPAEVASVRGNPTNHDLHCGRGAIRPEE